VKKYLQIHMFTSYPPSNLNRDDLGRPKTAIVGGTPRLRISSQSLKRAWRTSDVFQKAIGNTDVVLATGKGTGIRTKEMGDEIYKKLIAGGIKEKDATEWARSINGVFGKIKGDKEKYPGNLEIEQLAFFSPEEQKVIEELTQSLIKTKKAPTEDDLKLLKSENSAADLALFGRMLASAPSFNIEASVQVAHAISVQKVTIEDDFFTAVDDLNRGDVDAGASHLGEVEFASGIFYTYINIDRELLEKNFSGLGKKARTGLNTAIRGLVEAAATIAPTGKQNTFASRARSHYIMAELGDQQPRSLSLAFVEPAKGEMLASSIKALEETRAKMDKAYGKCSESEKIMDVLAERGTLEEILNFCVED
jgi:CRISPR system Cascade subunit CasC